MTSSWLLRSHWARSECIRMESLITVTGCTVLRCVRAVHGKQGQWAHIIAVAMLCNHCPRPRARRYTLHELEYCEHQHRRLRMGFSSINKAHLSLCVNVYNLSIVYSPFSFSLQISHLPSCLLIAVLWRDGESDSTMQPCCRDWMKITQCYKNSPCWGMQRTGRDWRGRWCYLMKLCWIVPCSWVSNQTHHPSLQHRKKKKLKKKKSEKSVPRIAAQAFFCH